MELLQVAGTAILSIVALFIITKCMGHKQVSQLDFFDYVCGITIGSIGAELATELETPLRPLVALVLYGLCSVLLSVLSHKFPRSRKFINGTPTILMDKGKLFRANMKKAKLDLSEFLLLCREQGYFDLSDIETAVFEVNGKLTVLPVSDKRPLTPFDMKLAPSCERIGVEVILDGRVMGENLGRMGKDEAWLLRQLKAQGHSSPKAVFLGIYRIEKDELTLYTGK